MRVSWETDSLGPMHADVDEHQVNPLVGALATLGFEATIEKEDA